MGDVPPSIGRLAVAGIAWSVVQSWGGRLVTFLLFVLLARFLDPAVFGVASIAVIVLGLITLTAEFGFGEAIVQRRELEAADVDLPFFASLAVAVGLAAACTFGADAIERHLAVPGLAPVLRVMVWAGPVTIVARYQEVAYRRSFGFRDLAFRVLVANLVGGSAAVVWAVFGAGVWSLVVQAYVAATVGLVWLWRRPLWRPTFEARPKSFADLVRFGLPLTVLRLADFAAVRFYEVVLIGRHGIAAYGIYAVAARLQETLLSLLQGVLADVSLTILSRISDDRERLAEAYRRTLVLAAFVTAPIFVAVAALIPEIASVLFGGKWSGVEAVARPLLLLGALQALFHFNASFLAARGRTRAVAVGSLAKSLVVPVAVLMVPTGDVASLVLVFALAQASEAPISFALTLRELRLAPLRLFADLAPAVLAGVVAFAAVAWARPAVAEHLGDPFSIAVVLGVVFVVAFGTVAAVVGFRQLRLIHAFVRARG